MKSSKNRELLNSIIVKDTGDERHADLQRYVVDYPNDPDGYLYLGLSWIRNQNSDAPGSAGSINVKQSKKEPKIRQKIRLRNLDYARENIKTFQRLTPERRAEAELFIGMTNLYAAKYTLTIERIRAYLKGEETESPYTDSLRLTLAIALRESGKINEAIAIITALDEKKQKSKHAHLSLAYLKKEEFTQALRHLEIDSKFVADSIYDTFIEAVRMELDGDIKAAVAAYRLFIAETETKVPFYFTAIEAERRLKNLTT